MAPDGAINGTTPDDDSGVVVVHKAASFRTLDEIVGDLRARCLMRTSLTTCAP